MRWIDEWSDVVLMAACGLLLALALAAAPAESRPHTHDGGRTWHAHAVGR